jgi:hypothetical protein
MKDVAGLGGQIEMPDLTVERRSMTRTRTAVCLALNGALLMLAGLVVGAAIPAVPYPRLMLAAHSAGFTAS